MDFAPGVRAVAAAEMDPAAASARSRGVPVLVLSTGAGGGRDAFFDAVRATMPLDPPLVSNYSWDALSDSLWEGVCALGADQVLLLWTDAGEMATTDPREADVAFQVLEDVATSLADPAFTNGRPVLLTVLAAVE